MILVNFFDHRLQAEVVLWGTQLLHHVLTFNQINQRLAKFDLKVMKVYDCHLKLSQTNFLGLLTTILLKLLLKVFDLFPVLTITNRS